MKELVIGLVVADDMEYAAYEEIVADKAVRCDFFGRKGHKYTIDNTEKIIVIYSILSGIGKVNASVAAMHLVDRGAKILLNYGLSGGISGVSRGQDIVGCSFIEHDFDLTCCGYKKCEKPGQKYIYTADEVITEIIATQGGGLKKCNLASGDRFVSDSVLRDVLKNEFGINSCDMETSAIAYVADLTNVSFASLRRISDDAGEDATADYHEMNNKPMTDLPELLLRSVSNFFEIESLWK